MYDKRVLLIKHKSRVKNVCRCFILHFTFYLTYRLKQNMSIYKCFGFSRIPEKSVRKYSCIFCANVLYLFVKTLLQYPR